jgi:hypothetical protein
MVRKHLLTLGGAKEEKRNNTQGLVVMVISACPTPIPPSGKGILLAVYYYHEILEGANLAHSFGDSKSTIRQTRAWLLVRVVSGHSS